MWFNYIHGKFPFSHPSRVSNILLMKLSKEGWIIRIRISLILPLVHLISFSGDNPILKKNDPFHIRLEALLIIIKSVSYLQVIYCKLRST